MAPFGQNYFGKGNALFLQSPGISLGVLNRNGAIVGRMQDKGGWRLRTALLLQGKLLHQVLPGLAANEVLATAHVGVGGIHGYYRVNQNREVGTQLFRTSLLIKWRGEKGGG